MNLRKITLFVESIKKLITVKTTHIFKQYISL